MNLHTRIPVLLAAVALTLAACEPTSSTSTAPATTADTTTTVADSNGNLIDTDPAPADPPPPAAPADPTSIGDPHARLALLTIAPEQNASTYNRDDWPHWIDADRDGCDTRQEVLITESLTDGRVDSRCRIIDGGTWNSILDGETGITDPSSLDIDHLVALSEAHRSGGWAWDRDRRTAFANDLGYEHSLVAVTAASNRSKGDKDPARWQPSYDPAWCWYAQSWIEVKIRWALTVDQAEHDALANMLNRCDGTNGTIEAVFAGTPAASPAQATPAPAPVPAPDPAPDAPAGDGTCRTEGIYIAADGSCVADHDADGNGDINCGELPASAKPVTVVTPGNDPDRLDGDGDGIGCQG